MSNHLLQTRADDMREAADRTKHASESDALMEAADALEALMDTPGVKCVRCPRCQGVQEDAIGNKCHACLGYGDVFKVGVGK